jgi:hypothetical protein
VTRFKLTYELRNELELRKSKGDVLKKSTLTSFHVLATMAVERRSYRDGHAYLCSSRWLLCPLALVFAFAITQELNCHV